MDYRLNKEALFHLNEELDRIDTSIFDSLADEDVPLGDLVLDAGEFDDF